MKLRFGKYKGEQLENTPKWYQDWLLSQDWFDVDWEATQGTKSLYKELVDKKKVHTVDGLIYLYDGMYMTADGEVIETDV